MNIEDLILVVLIMNFAANAYLAYVLGRIARYTDVQLQRITPYLPDQEDVDDLLEEATEMVRQTGKCSTSLLQRKFRIGYGRAARLIDLLAEEGIVEWQPKPSPGRWVVSDEPQSE